MLHRILLATLLLFGSFSVQASAQSTGEPLGVTEVAKLEAFLKLGREKDASTRYAATQIAGTDVTLVYLTGDSDCNLRSCTLLILRSCGDTYSVIGKPAYVNAPISIMDAQHHGLPDIGIRMPKDDQDGQQVALPFGGYFYPNFPNYEPAYTVAKDQGVIVIAKEDKGVKLFRNK